MQIKNPNRNRAAEHQTHFKQSKYAEKDCLCPAAKQVFIFSTGSFPNILRVSFILLSYSCVVILFWSYCIFVSSNIFSISKYFVFISTERRSDNKYPRSGISMPRILYASLRNAFFIFFRISLHVCFWFSSCASD